MRHLPIPQPPGVISPSERNWLALVSFGLGLCMLLGALITASGAVAFPRGIGMNVTSSPWELMIGYCQAAFLIYDLPISAVTILTGVLALRQARTFSPDHTWRRWAWIGLLLGGLSCLFLVGFLQFFPTAIPYNGDP